MSLTPQKSKEKLASKGNNSSEMLIEIHNYFDLSSPKISKEKHKRFIQDNSHIGTLLKCSTPVQHSSFNIHAPPIPSSTKKKICTIWDAFIILSSHLNDICIMKFSKVSNDNVYTNQTKV